MYIPVIHTKVDLGALGELVDRVKASTGIDRLRRGAEVVEAMWNAVERTVECIAVEPGKTRVYQDGLPVCGHELEIVRELAQAGSRNHKLLLDLEKRGAALMGTESPELLVEEYHLASTTIRGAASGGGWRLQEQTGATLLQKRDRFIALRIGATLQPGETGILFIGMLHAVQRYLDRDIEVQYPVKPF